MPSQNFTMEYESKYELKVQNIKLKSENDQLRAENERLRSENERLREALREIVDRGYTGASWIAQQALKEVKE